MTTVLVVSLAAHVALLGLAWHYGWLRYAKHVDVAAEQAKAEQVDRRQQERAKRERAERAELPIPPAYQRKLREEEELKRRQTLVRRVEDIRRDRDELRDVRDRRLEELNRRPKAPLRQKLAEELVKRAEEARGMAYEAENAKRDEARARQSRKAEALVNSAEQAKRDADTAAEAAKRAAELSKQMADAADAKRAKAEAEKSAAAAQAAAAEVAKQAAELAKGYAPEKVDSGGSADAAERAAAAGTAAQQAADLAARLATPGGLNPKNSPALHRDGVGPEQLANLAQKPAGQLYDTAKALERDADGTYADAGAAELATVQGIGFEEAKAKLAGESPSRPDLAAGVAAPSLETIAGLNAFREAMNAVVNEVDAIGVRTNSLVAQAGGAGPSNVGAETALARAVASAGGGGGVDLSGLMRRRAGASDGNSRVRGQAENEALNNTQDDGGAMFNANPEPLPELRVPPEQVIAKALPGRRFTKDLADGRRKGWLFIDTWYVIGPWDNGGKYDFTQTFPPERVVDFDATYPGKIDRQGKARQLKWQFQQTDIIRMSPPEVTGGSTYYAYTEVWCEQDQDLLIACATDDAGELWVNGTLVWQDTGWSEWRLDEGYRKVFFHKGFNTLLLRVDNGPGYCRWSLLLCPPGALKKD